MTNSTAETPSFAPRLYGIVILVAAIVVTGIWLIARFTSIDLARDMQGWQEKLNLIAESRTAELNNWVNSHFKELHTLADNPSLQLYITELQTLQDNMPAGAAESEEPAQKAYLRNLLLFTAERAGYSESNAIATINANVKQESKGGLAVLNNKNDVVVSTAMTQSTKELMLENFKKLPAGQDGFIDIQKDSVGTLYVGFVVPIFPIQGEKNPESQIGRVIGIKTIDNNFFGLLKHPGVIEKTLESVLIRVSQNNMEYISPTQDGSSALTKQKDRDKNKFVEANLLETAGNFISDKKDYRDKPVLATSRAIAGTPWTLIVKIDRQEALQESGQRRASMVVFFFLIIAIIVLIIFAVWWHAHSKRAMMMSYHFKRIAAKAQAQEQLLQLVADHQPESIYIIDHEQNYRFANRKTADDVGSNIEHIIGKSVIAVRGVTHADYIEEFCHKSLKTKQILYDVAHQRYQFGERIIRSAFVPIDHIPVDILPKNTSGVLVVEQDITEVVHEREQRISTHYQLVQTLLRLVDARDPFAANHSLLVSHISQEIAIEMDLDDITAEATRFAGGLMNVGKIVVPTELLTKTESLNTEEKRIIHDSMNASSDMIKSVSFRGPVSETLKQWQEKWDGTGSLGLKGENILISARIIAVANAFIGMISPRSWRNAIPIESANKFLLDQCDTHFDRRVVVALINYVENHKGKLWLNEILSEQRNAA